MHIGVSRYQGQLMDNMIAPASTNRNGRADCETCVTRDSARVHGVVDSGATLEVNTKTTPAAKTSTGASGTEDEAGPLPRAA